MIKSLATIITFITLLFTSNAYCENQNESDVNQNLSSDNMFEQSDNMFEQVDDDLEKITIIQKPTCDNQILYNKVIKKVKEYSNKLSSLSIKNKRKKALILANINGFEEVSAANFTPETDFKTANALIMLKINKKLKDEDFVVCGQKGKHKNPLYLIMYPYMNNYMVHIINLNPYSDTYDKISFIYP